MANALREIGRTLAHAWENVADGWRELVNRCSSALTRFIPGRDDASEARVGRVLAFPQWGLLAGEVIETDKSIIVKLELPGIAREDCDIQVDNDTLRIRGEKRMDRDHLGENYYVMERAYGSFELVIPLPSTVEADSAEASLRDGVLRVELPKKASASGRRITVR